MTSEFQTIVSGNAPDWALEVASPRDLSVLTQRSRPTVAFSQLHFSPAGQAYLDTLNPAVDKFKGMNIIQGGVGLSFSASGFKSDPNLPSIGRDAFSQKMLECLPDRDGKHEMVQTVVDAFAGFASAIDRKHLRMKFTLLADCPQWSVHEDAGQIYTAGLVLRERGTFVLPPGSCPRSARIKKSDIDIDYDASKCDMAQGRFMPTQSLCGWTEKVPHSVALGTGMVRPALFAFIDHHNVSAARPATPTRLMNWQDRVVNSLQIP